MASDLTSLIEALIAERPWGKYGDSTNGLRLGDSVAGRAMLALRREEQGQLVAAIAPRVRDLDKQSRQIQAREYGLDGNTPQHEPGWGEL